MKKLIIAVIAAGALSMGSCKKEELSKPSSTAKVKTIADIKDHTGWD